MAPLRPASSRPSTVRSADRWLDAAALLTLATGILLFAVGRSSLGALAAQSYQPPPAGVTWVSRAELHDAQTRWGTGLALAGFILALGAAVKHTAARRRQVD
ncbi:MAG: hypothetical protein JNJ98_20725 [Gemmatimonadetes bacterium]|nr:hypothetical protein [Gemmatimonadota bacterium]